MSNRRVLFRVHSSASRFASLGPHISLFLLGFLDASSLAAASGTCVELAAVASHDLLWQVVRCRRSFFSLFPLTSTLSIYRLNWQVLCDRRFGSTLRPNHRHWKLHFASLACQEREQHIRERHEWSLLNNFEQPLFPRYMSCEYWYCFRAGSLGYQVPVHVSRVFPIKRIFHILQIDRLERSFTFCGQVMNTLPPELCSDQSATHVRLLT